MGADQVKLAFGQRALERPIDRPVPPLVIDRMFASASDGVRNARQVQLQVTGPVTARRGSSVGESPDGAEVEQAFGLLIIQKH